MQPSGIKSAWLPDLLCPVLLLLFAVAIAYPRWCAGIDWRDEGLLAYGAERVLNGEIPHRDFISVQPPLSFYTAAGFFKLCGTSLATLRIFGLSLFLLFPILIYSVGRRLTLRPILSFAAASPACILGIPYVYFVPLAVWQGIAVSFAAVLLLVSAVRSKRRWLALPAGSLSAISLFLRHDQAAYTIISIFALLIVLNFARDDSFSKTNVKRALLFWLLGIGIVVIPSIVVCSKVGALPEMFRQLVVFPFATYRKTSSLPFPKFAVHKTVLENAVVLLYYLPPSVQTIATLYLARSILRRRFRLREAIFAFLIVWSALFYLQVTVRSDQTHLLMTLPPFFLLTAFGWSIVKEAIASHRTLATVLSAVPAILVVTFLWTLRAFALPDVTHAKEQLALKRGGVRIEQPQVVVSFVHSLQASVPPTRSILALPYQPMFYFLCERRNPTRWNYLWPGDQTARDHERFVEEAEHDPPAVVLLAEPRGLAVSAPAILEYVQTHYIRTGEFGNLTVYVRGDAD
jgi:hypothetical protein